MNNFNALSPALQALWTAVYERVLTVEPAAFAAYDTLSRDRAESEAWEAVRRANGGEKPCSTDDMIEGLAPIVARYDPKTWATVSVDVRAHWIEEAKRCLNGSDQNFTPEFRNTCALALAAWKAAKGER